MPPCSLDCFIGALKIITLPHSFYLDSLTASVQTPLTTETRKLRKQLGHKKLVKSKAMKSEELFQLVSVILSEQVKKLI